MRSICSIFVAKACFSLLLVCFLSMDVSCAEDNYSLWPRRPEAFARAKKFLSEGKTDDFVRELTPFIREKGMIGKEAREMLGNIRIREILSPDYEGLENYTVRRGDSWYPLAKRLKCPLDYLMHANQLMELRSLQVGEAIKYKTLNYTVEINVPEREIFLWDGDSFIKSYPIVVTNDSGKEDAQTSVKAKIMKMNGSELAVYSNHYASADKSIQLSLNGLIIDTSARSKAGKPGFYLKREDCNELGLLLRPGNEVSIIRKKKP